MLEMAFRKEEGGEGWGGALVGWEVVGEVDGWGDGGGDELVRTQPTIYTVGPPPAGLLLRLT